MKLQQTGSRRSLAMELASLQHRASSPEVLFSLLQSFSQEGLDISTCRKLFGLLILHGLDSISLLGDYLLRLFTTCRSLSDADKLFVKIHCPSVYTWNAIISAHAKLSDERTAIALFQQMKRADSNSCPDRVTFLTLLKASQSLRSVSESMVIHDLIIRSEYGSDGVVGNTVVDMFAKCGCIDEASWMFNNLRHKTLVSWSAMIGGYAELGYGLSALELFEKMLRLGLAPCHITYLNTLKACIDIQSLPLGRVIHEGIVKSGLEADVALASCLVDLYCKCSSLDEARRIFDFLPKRNVVSWGTMISGYVQQLRGACALELFTEMQQEGIDPDALIYCDILKACGILKAFEQGRSIHKRLDRSNFTSNVMVMTSVIDFYGKCGRPVEACSVFEQSGKQEEMLWSAMLTAYVENELVRPALELFESMLKEGIRLNTLTFLSVVRASGSFGNLVPTRLIHDLVIRAGLDRELVLGTVIIDTYVKLASLEEGHSVLKTLPHSDTVSWTTLMLGYAEHGKACFAVELLEHMQQAGITPDNVTFLCMLKACSSGGALGLGRLLHEKIIRYNFLLDSLIGNTLVVMYVKCGSLIDGHKVLDDLSTRTVISWTALISGYVEDGHGYTALQMFEKMQRESIEPNEVTLLYILKACANTGVIETGRWIHDKVIREGMMEAVLIGTVLVEMYGVCGSLDEARRVFDLLPCQDTVSWGALITGHAQHGSLALTVNCLHDMQREGLKPNAIVFASILSACSNAGFIQEGWHYLNTMQSRFGVEPSIEHYSCMVDLLGRAGYLKDAARLLESMPVLPNIIGWTSLLTSCKRHGNYDMGKLCFSNVVNLDPLDASSYLLLSSIFNDYEPWEHEDDLQGWVNQVGAVQQAVDAHKLGVSGL